MLLLLLFGSDDDAFWLGKLAAAEVSDPPPDAAPAACWAPLCITDGFMVAQEMSVLHTMFKCVCVCVECVTRRNGLCDSMFFSSRGAICDRKTKFCGLSTNR